MTNNKQQTAVDSIIELCQELLANHYSISHDGVCSEIIRFCQEQAKEMQKQMTIKLYADYENYLEQAFKNQCGGQAVILSFQEFYEQTYGGGEQ
jgi:hypothetical protein